jgi:hypothetical protein
MRSAENIGIGYGKSRNRPAAFRLEDQALARVAVCSLPASESGRTCRWVDFRMSKNQKSAGESPLYRRGVARGGAKWGELGCSFLRFVNEISYFLGSFGYFRFCI